MSAAELKNKLIQLPVLQIVFTAIILFQSLIIISLPLIPSMNDSAWYYMNVHYVKTGTYICESMYPSFHEPSQYYPFLGYSFFLFCCDKFAGLFHTDWATVVKSVQFLLYILSAFLVKAIVHQQTGRQKLAYIIAIVFLLYYPYFNYCNFVMSEIYTGFLVLLTTYLFTGLQANFRTSGAVALFLVAGYSILVKPVLLPIVIVLLLLFLFDTFRAKRYTRLSCMLAVFIFPVSQSVFSKLHYGNYSLQTGLGWHLWDRVIHYDKLTPKNSAALEELRNEYAQHGKTVSDGFWWDVAKELSELGYTEQQTQEICRNIALDGISENTFSYAMNTVYNSGTTFLRPPAIGDVYSTTEGYLKKVREFSGEQQHIPLTDQLARQACFVSAPAEFQSWLIRVNYRIAQRSHYYGLLFHNRIILLLYLLAGIFNGYVLVKSRFRKHAGMFVIWLIPFAVDVCSNMLEYSQPRFLLPVFIFVTMSLAVTADHLVRTLKPQGTKRNEGNN
jgi:hypothetical protein